MRHVGVTPDMANRIITLTQLARFTRLTSDSSHNGNSYLMHKITIHTRNIRTTVPPTPNADTVRLCGARRARCLVPLASKMPGGLGGGDGS